MPSLKYSSVLKVNSTEQPLASFNFSAPSASLGVLADVTIADKTLVFERGDQFDLLIRHNITSNPKTNLIKAGKVVGDNRSIGITKVGGGLAPADAYSVKGVDAIAEKWKLAPRMPVIIYDPVVTILQDNETKTNVNDSAGNPIVAETISIASLDLIQVLNFAYVTKCGFSEVIHNLPNYAIPRADFSLTTSYHSIAASFYSYFKPVVFEDDNRLFIIDIFGELPEGILTGARTVTASGYISYSKSTPDLNIVNAVLLSHKEISVQSLTEDDFPENVTFRTETDPPREVGTYGEPGWQKITTIRYIAEIHDDEDDPTKITADPVYKIETRSQQRDENGIVRDTLVEVQDEKYTNSWRLKIGYEKRTTAYVDTGSGSKAMQDVQTERGRIDWIAKPGFPGEMEKTFALIQVEGLVVIEGDEEEDPDNVVKTPLLEASLNGRVPDDDSATIKRLPISTTSQWWRYTGADQIQVIVEKLDQLKNRPESSGTTEHVGTNSVRVRNGDSINNRQVLLVDEASDETDGAREPISFDAGFIPYAVAKELALRALEQAKNPKATISCQLASFDAGIRRGSIRNIVDRDGNSVTAIVTGYSVSGTQAERGQIVIGQSIEGVVIA
jgi:hypothetical protein